MRLVVDLKKGAITKIVLNQLFAKTDLQSNFGVINLALVPQEKETGIRYEEPGYLSLKSEYLKPEVLNLKQLIAHFVKHRDEVITRRTIYDLKVAKHRMHILEALITAINNIDEVIKIIKESRDTEQAKLKLEERFNFDDEQAQAIVDMQLKRLTHLQIEDLQKEIKELQAWIDYLQDLLDHHEKILQLIKEDTNKLAEKYGDDRKTDIIASEVENINVEDMIKEEDVVILISKLGYIKRVPVSQYKSQGRGGKGTISAKLIEEDYINQMFIASTHDHMVFITNMGKAYWVKVHEIPEASKTSRGSHVKSLLAVSANEEITIVERIRDFSETEYLFMATANGIVKKTPTSEFRNAKARGMQAIRLDEGDRLVSSVRSTGKLEIMLISRRGQALRISEEDVRPMGRSSRGVNGMKLSGGDELCAATPVIPETEILVITESGFGKRVDFNEFSAHGRGTGGQKIFGNVDGKGEIIGALTVKEDDSVMCITSQGTSLRVDVKAISKQGRGSSGVRIVNIDAPDYVVGIDRIAGNKDE